MSKKIAGIATILLLIAVIAIGAAKANTPALHLDLRVSHNLVNANELRTLDSLQLDGVSLDLPETNLRLTSSPGNSEQRDLAKLSVNGGSLHHLAPGLPTLEVAQVQPAAGLERLDLEGLWL